MLPRFVGDLGYADAVTAANSTLGFAAVAVAPVEPLLAARLVLLAAIADGLDGVIAKYNGGTRVGEYLDSLADVVSFCVAPAALVVGLVGPDWGSVDARLLAVVGIPALFVTAGVVRLALYTAYDVEDEYTEGVQTTLAATILAAAVLAGAGPTLALGATAVFAFLMVSTVAYPDLLARDALAMGVVQFGAVLVPGAFGAALPKLLLVAAFGYLLLAPRYYWR